jgi:hypothetical protein
MLKEKPIIPLKEKMPDRVVKPDMFYADVWPRQSLDKERMQAYKEMELEGQIQILKITYSKQNQIVVIEYRSAIPHEWVLDDLRKRIHKKPVQVSMV